MAGYLLPELAEQAVEEGLVAEDGQHPRPVGHRLLEGRDLQLVVV